MFTGKKIFFLIIGIAVSTAALPSQPYNFHISEVPVFNYSINKESELLIMSYASYVIKNPEQWENANNRKKIVQVDIVFTKYPFDKKDWITHYDSLLKNRIQAISDLESGVLHEKVKWNLIIQTQCTKEEEAQHLFHGAVIWFKEIPSSPIIPNKVEEIPASQNINELMSGHYIFPDSTVFKVFERNSQWENILIVNDWTASMYQYGAQSVLWNKSLLDKEKVSRFVFFNDGDNHKKTLKTKGIYFAEPENINHIIQIMNKVQKNGNGGDVPENYIAALIKATDKTKYFKDVILIADNKSLVKDIRLLKELHVPIRIIICGIKKGETIRHDYLQLASATEGSVHTIEEDIVHLAEIKEGERVKILDIDYQRTHGRIIKTKPLLISAWN